MKLLRPVGCTATRKPRAPGSGVSYWVVRGLRFWMAISVRALAMVLLPHDRQMWCRVAGRGAIENLLCSGGATLLDFDEQLRSMLKFFGSGRLAFGLTSLQELVHLRECPFKGELRAVPSVVEIIRVHLSSLHPR